jgi:putative transposase
MANGRRLKCLTVADDFSHEDVDIAADYGNSGQYVTRLLDRAARLRGYAAAIRTDNGPEFNSRAFIGWAQTHGIRHILIEPGRPTQNGYIESFDGRFRDKCLNEHWFETLHQARSAVAAWRLDYNEVRPHGSIGLMPSSKFAELNRRHAGDSVLKHHPSKQRHLVTFNQDSCRINGPADGGSLGRMSFLNEPIRAGVER